MPFVTTSIRHTVVIIIVKSILLLQSQTYTLLLQPQSDIPVVITPKERHTNCYYSDSHIVRVGITATVRHAIC